MELKGSTFIVTGGASGSGRRNGAYDRRRRRQRRRRGPQGDRGPGAGGGARRAARFVKTDVTDEASGKAAVAAAIDGFGGLQGLVNCAGIVHGEKVVGKEGPHTLAGFARAISINLVGTFNLMRLAADAMARKARPMREGERGVIVYTASVAAFDGQIGQAAYSASKAGVVGMTLPIARELARYGIRVMTIAPGMFETPMMAQVTARRRRRAGQGRAVSAATGAPGGIRVAGARDRQQRHAQRRSDPAGWRDPDGTEVADAVLDGAVPRPPRFACLSRSGRSARFLLCRLLQCECKRTHLRRSDGLRRHRAGSARSPRSSSR